jgi:hypothetical protein
MIVDVTNVKIDYKEVIPTSRQFPEFYISGYGGHEIYATVSEGDREISVAVNGEMYISVPDIYNGGLLDTDNIIRSTSDLNSYGIDDDIRLNQFIKTISNAGFEIYHQNPWWELFSDVDPDGIVCETFYQAIDMAISLIKDEEYWKND